MGFFSFGKRVKNKRFDYIPQHYNAAEDELKERMAKYGETNISDFDLVKARIKSGLRMKARGNQQLLKEGKKQANIRLLIIVVFLVAFSAYYLQSDSFNLFLERLLN